MQIPLCVRMLKRQSECEDSIVYTDGLITILVDVKINCKLTAFTEKQKVPIGLLSFQKFFRFPLVGSQSPSQVFQSILAQTDIQAEMHVVVE